MKQVHLNKRDILDAFENNAFVKQYGFIVNTKYKPQLRFEPVLRKLLRQGILVRDRIAKGGNCKYTTLRLKNG